MNFLQRWWHNHHHEAFSELKLVTVPSAEVADDEVEVWSDMRYMRELLDEIVALSKTTPGAAHVVEDMLARPTIVEFDGYHDGLMIWEDPAAEMLERWRIQLVHERRFTAWWLGEQAAKALGAVA